MSKSTPESDQYAVSYSFDYQGWEIFAGFHIENLSYDTSFLLVLGPFPWLEIF